MLFRKKPDYRVCQQCGVHFEPRSRDNEEWRFYCQTHAEPIRIQYMRREAVAWAHQNWERLEPQMKEEMKEQANALNQVKFMYGDLAIGMP